MENLEKLIKFAPEKMQLMLRSVYDYNSNFIKSKRDSILLEKIIFSMILIDRKFFVENKEEAYTDTALSIGKSQTISQPSTVARILLLSEPEPYDNILEIGAGSGWNAALLALLSYPGYVLSLERIQKLTEKAKVNINKLKNSMREKHPQDIGKLKLNFLTENILFPKNVKKKQYNKIIFTAGIKNQEEKIEEIAKSFLKKGGKLICPYTEGPILILKKLKNRIIKNYTKESYVFVPLLEGLEK